MEEVSLINGVKMPIIGFGPMILNYGKKSPAARRDMLSRVYKKFIGRPYERFVQIPRDRAVFVKSISDAIKNGFRLIDYSASYGNLWAIGQAVKISGVNRKDIFLTGRISNHAQFGGRLKVRKQVHEILRSYGTDYVDLLMFHWPVKDLFLDTWDEICDLYKKGYARSVGVANCEEEHLSCLLSTGMQPMVNQIEIHPLFANKNVIKLCHQNNIIVESYTPLARMDDRLYRLPLLKNIAVAHRKTLVQVVLRWHIQKLLVPCVRCLKDEHQKEALDIFDFALSEEEVAQIDSINIDSRLRYDPKNCDFTIV